MARKAGFELPLVAYPLQAMVTLPVKPFLTPLVSSSASIAMFSKHRVVRSLSVVVRTPTRCTTAAPPSP